MRNETIADPALNPAAPRDLADLFTDLANAALIGQGRALAAESQTALAVVADRGGLAAEAASVQRDIRRAAGFHLNRGAQEIARAFANGGAAANLIEALATRIDAGADPAAAIRAAARSLERIYLDARDIADETARIARGAGGASDRLADALALAAERIGGDDGASARLSGEIAATAEEIERNLSELVAGAALIGDGGKRIVSSALTTITSVADATKAARDEEAIRAKEAREAEAKGEKPSAAEPSEAAKKREDAVRDVFKTDGFPVEAVDVATRGAAEASVAMRDFQANRARLAELYRQLAKVDALLAATSAIGSQAGGFARSMAGVARFADELATSWGRLTGDMNALAAEAGRSAPGTPERAHAACKIAAAAPLWRRLADRVRRLESSFAGADDAVAGLPEAAAL